MTDTSQSRVVRGLLKFGQPDHVEQLYRHGSVFMRSLRHFRELEGDTTRGDPEEGLEAFHQADQVRVTLEVRGQTIHLDAQSGLVGQVKLHVDAADACNVFCTTAIEKIGVFELDPRCKTFGQSCIWIRNVQEFMRRVLVAADAAGVRVSSGLVHYVPRDSYSGRMGPFRKFKEYEWQREFRILLVTNRDPLILPVGSLEDIASMFSTDEIG